MYMPIEDFEVQRAVYIYPQRTLKCRELESGTPTPLKAVQV